MLKVVVLVSGGGTNLQAILDAVDSGAITNTEIVGVISNNKNAYALQRAEEKGIPNAEIIKLLENGPADDNNDNEDDQIAIIAKRVLAFYKKNLSSFVLKN